MKESGHLEELDTELSQQKERESEKEDEKPLPKCMKMSDVQHILSAMDTLTDELCDNNHDWEWTAKVKKTIMISLGPYSEILKETKGKSQQSTLYVFFKKRKDH